MNTQRFFIYVLFCLFPALTAAQEATLSGRVRDQKSHQEIFGVNISIKGTQLRTTTDLNGGYVLRIINPNRQMVVVFLHPAYETREMPLDSVLFVNRIYLQPLDNPQQTAELFQAPELVVSGILRDVNTHQEIRGVNIFVQGTQIGSSSDFAGRYSLRILNASRQTVVAFRHIAYEQRAIVLDSLATMRYIYLQPRIIPLQAIEVEEEAIQRLEIDKDLPQATSVIAARNFEIRGYVDAGDLLRTDHSVQVEEEFSGKKTVAIRGGNADEVVVLYNGIKMNSAYDNVFDLSLVDLEDVERLEIIKGSNTALYGPEAFSGVVNIVPKEQQDYSIRFQQRFGTYRSGNWGLHLYQKLNRLHGSYSLKRGGNQRNFEGGTGGSTQVENTSLHHTANLGYSFAKSPEGQLANTLNAMFMHSELEYDNRRDVESDSSFNQLLSLSYTGDLAFLKNLDLSVALRRLEEDQFSTRQPDTTLNRDIADHDFHLNAGKSVKTEKMEFTLAYQFQRANLDFLEDHAIGASPPTALKDTELERRQHGLVAIGKFHGKTGSHFLKTLDLEVSLRHDRVNDEQTNVVPTTPAQVEHDWKRTTVKFAVNFSGYRKELAFNGYLSFGSNAKFPTLFQQISSPSLLTDASTQPNLNPEKNNSLEIGVLVTKDTRDLPTIYGWQVSGNFFQNHYDNKFRTYTVPGSHFVFYDNVKNARIAGVEVRPSLFLFRKKLTFELGLSRYFISDRAAFPFKSESKSTLAVNLDHAGYSLQVHWFKEGEQTGWVLNEDDRFEESILPDYSNLDVHLSKTFAFGRFKLFANASGRNLLDDDFTLQGLALRDRRFYLTIGAQY